MTPIINVEGLTKIYHIGTAGTERYNTLRDRLSKPFSKKEQTTSGSTQEYLALDDVSFTVNAGDRVGVVGRNGAGKSTLLKVLSRITEPTRGSVQLRGRVASLLEVGTGFHPELTGRENIYLNGSILGMSRREITAKFDEIVDFAEVERFLDTPVKRYSSGMYVRLAFAVAAHLEPEILVIDEVLAVGDARFQKKCLGKMEDVSKQQGRTVLFVSHDLSAVGRLCNKSLVLHQGHLKYSGNIAEGINYYINNQDVIQEKALENKVVRHLRIEQVDDHLELECHYKLDEVISTPFFAFIVYDQLNHPVFGATSLHLPPPQPLEASSEGKLLLTIEQPKLLDGTYSLSVTFGDGTEDFFVGNHILNFEVNGMVHYQRTPYPNITGVVSPVVYWKQEVADKLSV